MPNERDGGRAQSQMWRRDQAMRPRDWDERSESAQRAPRLERMQWRAAGAQFYPGGAFDQLLELSQRGRGPKGYQRSDERLREIICERLMDDAFIDPRDVTVEVAKGEVTLRGTVDMRQQKYAIEDLVADVSGVREIHNNLSVSERDLDDSAP